MAQAQGVPVLVRQHCLEIEVSIAGAASVDSPERAEVVRVDHNVNIDDLLSSGVVARESCGEDV